MPDENNIFMTAKSQCESQEPVNKLVLSEKLMSLTQREQGQSYSEQLANMCIPNEQFVKPNKKQISPPRTYFVCHNIE